MLVVIILMMYSTVPVLLVRDGRHGTGLTCMLDRMTSGTAIEEFARDNEAFVGLLNCLHVESDYPECIGTISTCVCRKSWTNKIDRISDPFPRNILSVGCVNLNM